MKKLFRTDDETFINHMLLYLPTIHWNGVFNETTQSWIELWHRWRCSLMALYFTGEKDFLLLGMISAQMNTGGQTVSSKRKHQKDRERSRTTYM